MQLQYGSSQQLSRRRAAKKFGGRFPKTSNILISHAAPVTLYIYTPKFRGAGYEMQIEM